MPSVHVCAWSGKLECRTGSTEGDNHGFGSTLHKDSFAYKPRWSDARIGPLKITVRSSVRIYWDRVELKRAGASSLLTLSDRIRQSQGAVPRNSIRAESKHGGALNWRGEPDTLRVIATVIERRG